MLGTIFKSLIANNSIIISIMGVIVLFLVLVAMASTCDGQTIASQIHLLRPQTGALGRRVPEVNCLSWRLAVETNNVRDWEVVPRACEGYVGHYMLGKQYRDDCDFVVDSAIVYAKSLRLKGDGKDIWVFDIDETALSNLPYYASSHVAFGAVAYNATKFNEWVSEGIAPPVPAVLRLYKVVVSLGVKVVFLTGTAEKFRQVRVSNLKRAGYHTWEKLILRGESDEGSAVVYKSAKRTELVNAGYRIVGNIGDQWSDLLGMNPGNRTFKIPDPMYYIG